MLSNPSFEPDGDHLYVYEHCEYDVARSAGHSERLDETFYETIWSCNETRTTTFRAKAVERTEDAALLERGGVEWCEAVEEAQLRLTGADGEPEMLDWYEWGEGVRGTPALVVDVENTEYRVEYERE